MCVISLPRLKSSYKARTVGCTVSFCVCFFVDKNEGERLDNREETKLFQGFRGRDREKGMDRGEGGRKGCSKMPASAVKPVWALCSECVRTCAHWCAFAQSALTLFKVTVSGGEHPHGDQCPANTHACFTLLLSPLLSS